ncbi:hypothetical protein D3C84_1081740 [compost metagenome]
MRQQALEDFLAHLPDGLVAVDDLAAVDVHVITHAVEHGRIARQFEGGCRDRAKARTTTCGERDHVGTAGDLAGRGDRVVARRIHKDQASGRHRVGVFVHIH